MSKKIYLASDHAGFEFKEYIKKFLVDLGYEPEDLGPFQYDQQDDYPDFISKAADLVASDPENSVAVVLGGSGQGEAMVANRRKGVRTAVLYDYNEDIARLSREHNDANILSLGARYMDDDEAKNLVKTWLETPFSGEERHSRRIKKIDQ